MTFQHHNMNNPYLKYADSILPRRHEGSTARAKVVRSEREAPIVLRGADAALAERSKQTARHKRWQNAELQDYLRGPWGEQIVLLRNFLRRMTLQDGDQLLDLMNRLDWLQHADAPIRALMLSAIDEAIINLRVDNGLPPIDDALPGEALTVFQIVKAKLDKGNVNHGTDQRSD